MKIKTDNCLLIGLLLTYASWSFCFFPAPSLYYAFLLSAVHCCLMDDDLESCLVMVLLLKFKMASQDFKI